MPADPGIPPSLHSVPPPAEPALGFRLSLFVAGKLVVNTATRFVYAFLPAIARGLGVSVEAAGTLASVRWASGALTPVTVRLAGRGHRRRIVLVGLGLFVVGALVTAALGFYAGAVIGFVFMGVAKPVFDSGTQAWVADRVPYVRRARVLGILETTWAVSFLVGAPAAGWLIDRSGWTAPFWATAVAALAVLALLAAAMREPEMAADASGAGRPISWDRASMGFLVGAVLIVGSVEMMFITYATWLEDLHGFSVAGLAVVATVVGVTELAAEAATVAFTDRLGKPRAVALGLAVSAAGFLAVALLRSTAAPAVAGLVVGIGGFEFAFVSSIPLGTELQPAARIQYLSRFVVAQAAGRAMAALVGLAVFSALGMGGVATAAAAVAVVAGLVILGALRDHEVASPRRGARAP